MERKTKEQQENRRKLFRFGTVSFTFFLLILAIYGMIGYALNIPLWEAVVGFATGLILIDKSKTMAEYSTEFIKK